MQTFGEFVREQRRLLGLTQRQIAQALGLRSIAYWSDVEANNRRPSRELLPTLARVLQIPLASLEAHDTRAPLAQARALLQRHPEYAVAFCRVIEHSRELGLEEILRRIEQSPTAVPDTSLPAPAASVSPVPPAAAPKARPAKPPQPDDLFPDLAA
jgi:transcriptional regulator with XRE-family HTH domain